MLLLQRVDIKQQATTRDHPSMPTFHYSNFSGKTEENSALFRMLVTASHRNAIVLKLSVIINKFQSEMCHRKFITKILENALSAHKRWINLLCTKTPWMVWVHRGMLKTVSLDVCTTWVLALFLCSQIYKLLYYTMMTYTKRWWWQQK